MLNFLESITFMRFGGFNQTRRDLEALDASGDRERPHPRALMGIEPAALNEVARADGARSGHALDDLRE
jgi:hypothetical protein